MEFLVTAEVIGLLANLAAGGKQLAAFRRQFDSEASRFWAEFSRALENDPDIDWSQIASHSELQPRFFGLMVALTYGLPGADDAMRDHFVSFVEPPSGGRYGKDETVERIMRAAEEAAVAAAPDDAARGLAHRRILQEKLQKASAEVLAAVDHLDITVSSTHDEVAQVKELTERLLSLIETNLQGTDSSASPSIDREQVQALLEEQTSVLDERAEQRVDQIVDRLGLQLARRAPDSDLDVGGSLEGGGSSDKDVLGDDHLAPLRASDPAAAERLQAVAQRGVEAVAEAVVDGTFDAGPVGLLTAAARIATEAGRFASAEAAYLGSVNLPLADQTKARQYVRAAQVASIQGSEGRYQQHLASARLLDPTNPALLIAEARASSDGRFMLDHVAAVEPATSAERAVLHQTRAQAHLALGDETAAQEEYELAEQADSNSEVVREFGAILVWHRAQQSLGDSQAVDQDALRNAADTFEELARSALAQGRTDEATQVLARAVHCRLLAHQEEEAGRILEDLPDASTMSTDTAVSMAGAAMLAERADIALTLLPADVEDARVRLIRADALTHSDQSADRQQGIAGLRDLLDDGDPDLVAQAALAMLLAASAHEDIEWDERAAQIVGEGTPEAVAATHAERANMLGDRQEAQRLLLPYAHRLHPLRRLRDYAALAGDWERVKDRSLELLRIADDPRDRLALGEALRQLGEIADARHQFTEVANKATVKSLQDAAFSSLIDLAGLNRDYEAILKLSREWGSVLPGSEGAIWNEMFALARLARHDEAFALANERDVQPQTESQATVMAEILHRAAPPSVAVVRLIQLSDQFGRQVEALEALVIAAAIDTEAADRTFDQEIEDRIRDTFASFPDRFPDSRVIRTLPAPQTAEEAAAFLQEIAGDRPRRQADLAREIERGEAPVNALAALSNGGIAKTWSTLSALPMGFAVGESDDLDAARTAIGGAAVWDSSGLFVTSMLSEDLVDRIRASLPGSVIVTETLEDIDGDAPAPRKPWAHTVHSPSGDVGLQEVSEEQHAAEVTRLKRVLEVARSLDVKPSMDNDSPSEMVTAYAESHDVPELAALFGTLLRAQRTGRPLYSDDRFVRKAARMFGISAFGTHALIDALADQDLIDGDTRRRARCELATRGAWGVVLDGDEFIAIGRETGFQSSPALESALNDRARWRADPLATWHEVLLLLVHIYEDAPENLSYWVRRVLSAAHHAAPEVPSWMWLEMMIMLAWTPGRPVSDDRCFQAILDIAKELPPALTAPGYEPVLIPFRRMLAIQRVEDGSTDLYRQFRLYLRRLRLNDQVRMLNAFLGLAIPPPLDPHLRITAIANEGRI